MLKMGQIELLERVLTDLGDLTTLADGYENDYVEFKILLDKIKRTQECLNLL